MNPAAYLEMAETESRHWWFVGRRKILSRLIEALGLPKNARILEVGCGTGGNLEMLAKYGTLSALELDDTARGIAEKKTDNRFDIRPGHCPDAIPFKDQKFDLICMFDVLEHIEQDTETLSALKNLLSPNGRILLTVPAYQWMYGAHDKFLHHKRRYSVALLGRKMAAANLALIRISYFNTILFPLAALIRLKEKLFNSDTATGAQIPPAFINNLFRNIFGSERFLLERINLPFGVSIICLLQAADGS